MLLTTLRLTIAKDPEGCQFPFGVPKWFHSLMGLEGSDPEGFGSSEACQSALRGAVGTRSDSQNGVFLLLFECFGKARAKETKDIVTPFLLDFH
jgi:hypothetical protein